MGSTTMEHRKVDCNGMQDDGLHWNATDWIALDCTYVFIDFHSFFIDLHLLFSCFPLCSIDLKWKSMVFYDFSMLSLFFIDHNEFPLHSIDCKWFSGVWCNGLSYHRMHSNGA